MKKYVRLPNTNDGSLRAWSSVDEYIMSYLEEGEYDLEHMSIFHDRFGYLTCNLVEHKPTTITYLESQRQSIDSNALTNGVSMDDINLISILDEVPLVGRVAIMKVPKSQDLFRLYLIRLIRALPSDGIVIAGFMTRHFTKAILDITAEYFGKVEQSKAWKKSRLLLLSDPKKSNEIQSQIIKSIIYKDYEYQQHLGVFSANHIDYATQFLLEHLELRENENSFLDIGSGNGVIGKHLLDQQSWEESVMMDDSILATASSKLNVKNNTSLKIITNHSLIHYSDGQFDLVITNPPFHFEYEVDPSIAIQLIHDTHRILSDNGRLVIVANRHLNYKSQLSKWYSEIKIINENDKFVIYEATK